jgi:hypothetical protein
MGYYTNYKLSVSGVDGVNEPRLIRKHPDFVKFSEFLETVQDEENQEEHEAEVARITAQAKKMGLKVETQPPKEKLIVGNLPILSVSFSDLNDFYVGNSESCKWYEHEDDVRKFSKMFPTLVFKLQGEGEQSNDLWVKYFKDGKMQSCPAKIVYDDYDVKKLK